MPSKHRQYSIVFQNVDKSSQPKVHQYATQAKKFVMSVEPNPQGDGYHAHLYIQYKNPRNFKAVLAELERFKTRIVVPKPADESRDWGRVQVDVMRGSFDQATSYLKGETKDKPLGEVLHENRGCLLYMFQPGGILDGKPNPIFPNGFKLSDVLDKPNPFDYSPEDYYKLMDQKSQAKAKVIRKTQIIF